MSDTNAEFSKSAESSKSEERRAFVVLSVFLAPAVAVVIVGGYGFAVWMSQILLGPPGGQ